MYGNAANSQSQHLHLHDLALGKVPVTCGCLCVCGLIHHKPFWKHHAKPAMFLLETQHGQTTTLGTLCPSLFEQCMGSVTSAELATMKSCETWPMVDCPYLRKLDSLTTCRCNYKGSTFCSVIYKDTECWSGQGLNPQPSHMVVRYSTN